MSYEIECEKGKCKGVLKLSPNRTYAIPRERISSAFADRIKQSPHADYLGFGLNIQSRQIDEKARTVTFTASTECSDRMGDVIDQSGWQLDNYRANPVGLFAHDSQSLPICKGLQTEVSGGNLLWRAQFATKDENPFADQVFRLIVGGYLNAASVGFIPLEFEFMEDATGTMPGVKFTKTELLEISIVPVPANPEALVFGRGLEAEAFKLSAGVTVESPFDRWIEALAAAKQNEKPKTFLENLIDVCSREASL